MDCGDSFTQSLNISAIDKIRFLHVFENGNLLITSHTQAWYSDDWLTLKSCTVLGIDGLPFVPTLVYDNFTAPYGARKQTRNGLEVLMWGNYNQTDNQPNVAVGLCKSYVWFTEDFGVTVKCIFQMPFSSTTNAGVLNARHIHDVCMNPEDESFWITTGDEPTSRDSHWIKAAWNNTTSEWEFLRVGSGSAFKSGMINFYDGYIYHAHDVAGGGLKRVLVSEASDVSKHSQVYVTGNDLLGFFLGERGDMLLVVSKFFGPNPGREMYYTADRVNFNKVLAPLPSGYSDNSIFFRVFPPNTKGKILSAIMYRYDTPYDTWNLLPSIWLDEVVKRAGFPDAFKPL